MEEEIAGDLQMHRCTIEEVYPSGMIDAQSTRGSYFERINLLFNGVEGSYSIGDQTIVLSDGAQKFALGFLPEPKETEEGRKSIHRFENDIVDWNQAKVIAVEDAFETQSRVIVAPGGGIMIDTGEWCMRHYDPGLAKMVDYAERKETIMPSHHANIDHNGATASAHYEWRTQPSGIEMDKSLMGGGDGLFDLPNINPTGSTIEFDISEASDLQGGLLKIFKGAVKTAGQKVLGINIRKFGSLEIVPKPGVTIHLGGPKTISVFQKKAAIGPFVEAKVRQMTSKYSAHTHTYLAPLIPLGLSQTAPPAPPQAPPTPTGFNSRNVFVQSLTPSYPGA
ncbi:MAG: hypothetical protein ABEN55_10885 [Bradymonadaceae bacterium]